MKDEFRKHACEFKNESECEEELDEKVLDIDEEESKHYEDAEVDLEEDVEEDD